MSAAFAASCINSIISRVAEVRQFLPAEIFTSRGQAVFHTTLSVRDYECDMQGVVNNAVYLHYLEHARHEFLHARGLDFAELTRQGITVVVIRAELEYKCSLRSGDHVRISVRAERTSPLRVLFHQEIRLADNDRLALSAVITTTAVNARGRPWFPEKLAVLLE
ncbi:MAG: thioesterase family protein [Pseudomonadales bacterium]|nr:thioesterase family protein [Pseudomonadales bacterium]